MKGLKVFSQPLCIFFLLFHCPSMGSETDEKVLLAQMIEELHESCNGDNGDTSDQNTFNVVMLRLEKLIFEDKEKALYVAEKFLDLLSVEICKADDSRICSDVQYLWLAQKIQRLTGSEEFYTALYQLDNNLCQRFRNFRAYFGDPNIHENRFSGKIADVLKSYKWPTQPHSHRLLVHCLRSYPVASAVTFNNLHLTEEGKAKSLSSSVVTIARNIASVHSAQSLADLEDDVVFLIAEDLWWVNLFLIRIDASSGYLMQDFVPNFKAHILKLKEDPHYAPFIEILDSPHPPK